MGLMVPIINGRRYDHTSIRVAVNGLPVLGQAIKSLAYRESKKPGVVRGFASQELGRTRGDYDASGSLEIPKEELPLLLAAITGGPVGSAAYNGYLDATFEISAAYADKNAPLQVDDLNGCQITDIDETHAGGGDGLSVRLDIIIHTVIRNGMLPLAADAMLR